MTVDLGLGENAMAEGSCLIRTLQILTRTHHSLTAQIEKLLNNLRGLLSAVAMGLVHSEVQRVVALAGECREGRKVDGFCRQ